MFKIPRVNVIESDEGFSVEVLGRTGLNYIEGNRVLWVDSEMLSGPAGLLVYSKSIIKWEDGMDINKNDVGRIISNIQRAFKFRGIEIQIA